MADGGYTRELKAYISLGQRYVRKKDILLLFVLALVLTVAVLGFALPLYEQYTKDHTLYTDSAALADFSGNAAVYDRLNRLLYEGALEAGVPAGYGRLYDPGGVLLYEGEFIASGFAGNGSLYDKNGTLRYTGQFNANLYHGTGLLYSADGGLVYDGAFVRGQYNGYGKLYENGTLRYEGEFFQGLYAGQGIEMSDKGYALYQGGFTGGVRNGYGKLYGENGTALFAGLFSDGGIRYASLLGVPMDQAGDVFLTRPYASAPDRKAGPETWDGKEGKSPQDEPDTASSNPYVCVSYEKASAALVFGYEDGAPAYAEAVIFWNAPDTDTDFNTTAQAYVPPWMEAFLNNPLCPEKPSLLWRKTVPCDNGTTSAWYSLDSPEPLWYSVEYTGLFTPPDSGAEDYGDTPPEGK